MLPEGRPRSPAVVPRPRKLQRQPRREDDGDDVGALARGGGGRD